MFNDLWIDEAWSAVHLGQFKGVSDILTVFKSDNNHPLASLWMYTVMPTHQEWLLRLPSWIAGIAAVWLSAEVGRLQYLRLRPGARAGEKEVAAVMTAALFGQAYLFTVYFSEARGYGLAVAFSLLAFFAVLRDADRHSIRWAAVYWCACILGLLAHPAVGQIIVGAIGWSAVRLMRSSHKASMFLALVHWHSPPLIFAAGYYIFFLRELSIGGGPIISISSILQDLVVYACGLPAITYAVTIVVLLVGVAWLFRRSSETALFHGLTIFIMPVAMLEFSRSPLIFPRYLIISCTFGLLVGGYFLAVAWSKTRAARPVLIAYLVITFTSNIPPTLQLLHLGRGNFRALLRYMAEHTPTTEISICSDQFYRAVTMLQYYEPNTLPDRQVRVFESENIRLHSARWLIVHQDNDAAPATFARDGAGNVFTYEASFPHAPLSGLTVLLYRDRRFP